MWAYDFSWLGPTNHWPACSLILRKISKIGDTYRCQILRLKCIKFCWGCAQESAWGTYSTPSVAPLAVLKGLLLRGKDRGDEVKRDLATQKIGRGAPMTRLA